MDLYMWDAFMAGNRSWPSGGQNRWPGLLLGQAKVVTFFFDKSNVVTLDKQPNMGPRILGMGIQNA